MHAKTATHIGPQFLHIKRSDRVTTLEDAFSASNQPAIVARLLNTVTLIATGLVLYQASHLFDSITRLNS